jgi:hypothetical protein
VTEFGAVCTACHSAEVHKAVTATPATCTSCHHSPQNERCESCHRAQSAFYRGQANAVSLPSAKVEPNVMASAVGCTGCHDWSKKHSRQLVAEKCVGCHDSGYVNFFSEWTAGFDKATAQAIQALKRAESSLVRERRAGRKVTESETLVKEARSALSAVQKARGVHNPPLAEELLQAAREKAEAAMAQAAKH